MTTYLELQDAVSAALQDPDNLTFDPPAIKAMIASAWADLSDMAPRRFQEDIDPIADTTEYPILADDFPLGSDDITLMSVEIWDASEVPATAYRQVQPASAHPMGLSYSQAGWRFWGGTLYIPDRVMDLISVDDHIIRVWGYAPWPTLTLDADVVPFGQIHEQALIIRCQIEAYRRLINNRVLFTQWQTRTNNTDVSPAFLMNEKAEASEEWRRRLRSIAVIREQP